MSLRILVVLLILTLGSVASGDSASSAAQGPNCTSSLQDQIDSAEPWDTVYAAPCIYRESVRIDKPLTLIGTIGSEIRGSDIWANGWVARGRVWVHSGAPAFVHAGVCKPGSDGRCLWAEQVFLDGAPLRQVAGNPTSGQFSIEGGSVIMGDDPARRLVEVTTRQSWLTISSDNVTVRSFTMRHAASPAQEGALRTEDNATTVVVRDSVLSDAHGANVRGWGMLLLNNDISRAGQIGVAGGGSVVGNRIHDNNTEEFDPGWGAGGLKSSLLTNGFWDGNEVWGNDGPGLWCDIQCTNVTITRNRVHHNSYHGILYEISTGGQISENAVWANGFSYQYYGGGAGIMLSTTANTSVFRNTVAWNATGIALATTDRGAEFPIGGNAIFENAVAMDRSALALGRLGAPPVRRGSAPVLVDVSRDNLFWYPGQEDIVPRFVWGTEFSRLTDVSSTTGVSLGRYLSTPELTDLLRSRHLPLQR